MKPAQDLIYYRRVPPRPWRNFHLEAFRGRYEVLYLTDPVANSGSAAGSRSVSIGRKRVLGSKEEKAAGSARQESRQLQAVLEWLRGFWWTR
jgi:hypothetical protein